MAPGYPVRIEAESRTSAVRTTPDLQYWNSDKVIFIQIHNHIKSSLVLSATFDLTWILTPCFSMLI